MLNRLLSIASWLLIFCAYSQNKVELIVSPTSVEVGESFNITITSYVKGDPVFDQFPDSFVPDYTLTQGSKPVMDHNTGNIRIVYFYSLSGVINTEGKYTIGPASRFSRPY